MAIATRRPRLLERPLTHQLLIERLVTDYPDGWALSCASRPVRDLLPLLPAGRPSRPVG